MRTRWGPAIRSWLAIGVVLGLLNIVAPWMSPVGQARLATGDSPDLEQPTLEDETEPKDETEASEETEPETTDVETTGLVTLEGVPVSTGLPFGEPTETEPGLSARWDLTDDDSVVLVGYRSKADFDVTLPIGWTAGQGQLTGRVVASDQARDDASLRIDVSGEPAGTWSSEDAGELAIPVAFDQIEDSTFPVDIVGTTPLTGDQACPDANHVARWLDLRDLAIWAKVVPTDLDVTRAIRGIGTVSQITNEPINVVTASRPSAATMETIGNMAAAVGHYGLPSSWKVRFDGQRPTQPGTEIWIEENPGATARISVRVVDDRPRIELVGEPSGLVRLTSALADPDRIEYFHYTRVAAVDVPVGADFPIREVFRFEEDGYDDRTLRGIGHQSLIYRVHIPAGVPPDAATLALYATFSPSMAKVESTVSVRINGSPEEIVAVVDASGQLDALHTVAPANLRPGLNYVKLTTQLAGNSSGSGACGAAPGEGWFTVSNASGIGVEQTPEPQEVRIGIEDARFALATPVDFNSADVSIPDNFGTGDVELAASVIGQLSHRAQGGSPRLTHDEGADRSRHLVVIGADQERELLESVPKVARSGAIVDDSTIAAQALGMVAAKPSPYTVGRVLLAFTGATRHGATRAVEVAMSSDVNDITAHHALVSPDSARPVGDEASLPSELAYRTDDDQPEARPASEQYDQWVLEQAERIEAAREPERDQRRVIALSLLVLVSIVAGLWWLQRTRRRDPAAGH